MPQELEDLSPKLFGRQPDLDDLWRRSEHPGVTVVLAEPQMGKTFLLRQFAYQLAQRGPALASGGASLHLDQAPGYLVGYYELTGESDDYLLRSTADLYARWLKDATYRQQARVVFSRQKDNLIPRLGESFGELIKCLAEPLHAGEIGDVVLRSFQGLATANSDLKSGGIELPRLPIETARKLLELLQQITPSTFVLIFDQWEKATDSERATNQVDSIVRQLDGWPPCHIFVGVRDEKEETRSRLSRLQQDHPTNVGIFRLPAMHLDDGEAVRMLAFVRDKNPATRTVPDVELMEMIRGYARVVARFTETGPEGERLSNEDDLRQAAEDAIAYRYPQFEARFCDLAETKQEELALAMRLAVLPACTDVAGKLSRRSCARGQDGSWTRSGARGFWRLLLLPVMATKPDARPRCFT